MVWQGLDLHLKLRGGGKRQLVRLIGQPSTCQQYYITRIVVTYYYQQVQLQEKLEITYKSLLLNKILKGLHVIQEKGQRFIDGVYSMKDNEIKLEIYIQRYLAQ